MIFTKFLISTLLFVFCFYIGVSQSIYTSDGVYVGELNTLLEPCMKGVDEKLKTINDAYINPKDYCTCIYMELVPSISSEEIKNLDLSLMESLLNDETHLNTLLSCFQGEEIGKDHMYSYDTKTDNFRVGAINYCYFQNLNDSETSQTYSKNEIKKICTCIIDNILSKGYSLEELIDRKYDSLMVMEIFPCIEFVK